MKQAVSCLIIFGVLAGFVWAAKIDPSAPVPVPAASPVPAGNPTAAPAAAPANPLVWDKMEKQFDGKVGDTKAEFAFTVTNSSKEIEVLINNVQPSCGCTTPSLPPLPIRLSPGGHSEIKATVDLHGKNGNLAKTLTVYSSAGIQNLILRLNLPQDPAVAMGDRARNMEIAKADPQAVFKGTCVECHVTPTLDKQGEGLYVAACAICHDPVKWATVNNKPGHHERNQMVPDLAALSKPFSKQGWKITIANGMNKKGSLMPAFSKRNGGPLTDEQLESLAEYTAKTFRYDPLKAQPAGPRADSHGHPEGAHK
jgi:mono/diheme cytochrome c family protein